MLSKRGRAARSWGTILTELPGILVVFYVQILILLLLRTVYCVAVVGVVTVFNSVSDQFVP